MANTRVANNLFTERARVLSRARLADRQAAATPEPTQPDTAQDRGVFSALLRGLKAGSTGQILGADVQQVPKDETALEHIAALGGEVISDIPAFAAGAAGGAALGGPLGGAAGAFALPSAIKTGRREVAQLRADPEDLTFSKGLGALYNLGRETAKSAAVGAVTGAAGRLAPILSKIPGLDKLARSKAGRAAIGAGLEYGGLTGGKIAVEGELPSKQELIDNALVLGGFKAGGLVGERAGISFKKYTGAESISEGVASMMPDSVQKTAKSLGTKIANIAPQPIKDVGNYLKSWKLNKDQKKYSEMVRENYGEKAAKNIESQFKWKEARKGVETEHGKFTPTQLEEMIYFKQKTGNPKVKGDTFKELSARLPKHAKDMVKNVITPHLKESLEVWNKDPLTKKINPKDAIREVYLPGLYEFDPKTFDRVNAQVASKFKTNNPFTNEKIFTNYMDAFKQAGYKPRYDNVFDLMKAYDAINTKTLGNLKLLDQLGKLEAKEGKPFVVNKRGNFRAYNKAKEFGYKPFQDKFLTKGSDTPALVHPSVAPALEGVFNKDAYKPDGKLWKTLDKTKDIIRFGRVALSPFHYVALTESAVGALGRRGLRFRKWAKEGRDLRANKEFMKDAARSGLNVNTPVEPEAYATGQKVFDKIERSLYSRNRKTATKALQGFRKFNNYLFEQFHPNIKATTWKDFVEKESARRVKEGNPFSEAELGKVKRDMADLVNNMYGGQVWENINILNNPKNMKMLRRVIGYSDWTISAARQAADAFGVGIKGKVSRKYWGRYLAAQFMTHGLLKFALGGLTQTDPEKSVAGVRFDPDKATKALVDPDPAKWFDFPLPDIDVKIGDSIFNPGRDRENRKLYSHFGKQFLEIGRYFTNPMSSLFAKSNPLIQMFWKQLFDKDPSGFVMRGKWKYGDRLPWDATDPGTVSRFVSRAKQLGADVTPFAAGTLIRHGAAPFVGAGLGAVPISKGMTLFKATPFIEKALKANDKVALNRVITALRDNNYKSSQIRRKISTIRNALKTRVLKREKK
jgi:hypothetical protein